MSPWLFNFALEYATRRVHSNLERLNMYGTHQLLVYADDVIILGGSVHAKKKNAKDIVIASKESGLEVNAEVTKYMVMSRKQNSGDNHNIKLDNKPLENWKN
jgi:hypothetical protein